MVHADEELQFIDNAPQSNGRFSSIPIKSLSDEVTRTSHESKEHAADGTFCGRKGDEVLQQLFIPKTLDSDSPDNAGSVAFLKPPPKHRRVKKKKKKNSAEKCKPSSRKGSCKTIDSIPASIPEENSEDVISSDPDIETVEYVNTNDLVDNNQQTVHSVHQIFSELDELVREQGEHVWEEKARWIKFEQDIYRGADKWSKPHVATLKLHSIISLRRCITHGTVLLGMNAFNLESVIEMTLDRLVSRALITSSVADQLRTLLLKRHIHTGEHQDSLLKFHMKRGKHGFLSRIAEGMSPAASPPTTQLNSRANSEQDLLKMKQHFLRKLPADTEASNVMIGRLDYLEVPICVTIRLSHSILLGDITEVPIPTRFIFLLLCPQHSKIDHVEVGRAASTLFSDESFYKTAYSASSKAHVIQGIDRFLEKAIVIPPSEWNPKMKITLPEEDHSPEEQADRELDQVELGEELKYSHYKLPLRGIQCDVKALRRRWTGDWKRGIQLLPLVSPLQFSMVTLCYVMFLVQLSAAHLQIAPLRGLTSAGMFCVLSAVCFCQPLVIACFSLPVALWEVGASMLCQRVGLQYLDIRPLVGILAGILLFVSSILNAGNAVPAVSKFVYEAFVTALPITMFVVVLIKLCVMSQDAHLLVCSIVLLLISLMFLKLWNTFTTSTMFTKKIRSTLKVFNIGLLVLVSCLLLRYTPVISSSYYPASLSFSYFPTNVSSSRGNTTNTIFPNSSAGAIVAGVVAGTVLTLLVFLQYSVVFNWVVQPSHKLKRVNGKYLDQCFIGAGVVISGIYRLPFLVPDPLLTSVLLNVLSLTSSTSKDVLYVHEQRATLFISGFMIFLPILVGPYLHEYVPLPMCWGVVLFYSGVAASHTQLFERCKILLQSEKYHPEKSYVENTPQNIINSYTITQIVIVSMLVVAMAAPYSCTFLPLLIIILILLRQYMLPLLIFENLIKLLEDKKTPVPVRCTSPSPSLSNYNNAEFSEEVSRLTNGCTAEQTDPEEDQLFPQIIFDNLTDDDGYRVTDNGQPGEDSDTVAVDMDAKPADRRRSSLDFLVNPSNMADVCPLPFQVDDTSEEPVRSENPYIYTSTYIDCV